MSNQVDSLPPSSIPLMTPTKARGIARSLKALAVEYTGIGMYEEADSMACGSEWWVACAMALEHAEIRKG